MSNIFFIGDTHFGHSNILKFTRPDGSPLRKFTTIEEMDEHLVAQWNSVVGQNDLTYHLGDVVMNKKFLPIVYRLNGRKILIRGNHDKAPITELLKYFEEVHGSYELKDMILSHIPLAKQSLGRFGTCVHGHLHAHNIMDGKNLDTSYFNVSAEQINYTPISLDQLRKKIEELKNVKI